MLLSSGIALLIVLIGWSNQITSKGKELKETEKAFIEKAKIKEAKYKKMIQEKGATERSFEILIDFLYTKKDKEIAEFEKIKSIKKDFEKLNAEYNNRFWILVILSVFFLITGVLTLFVDKNTSILCLKPEHFLMYLNVFPIIAAYCNLVHIYNIEKRFAQTINEVMEAF
jgi:cytochrome b subunit of formate dehydrogenase